MKSSQMHTVEADNLDPECPSPGRDGVTMKDRLNRCYFNTFGRPCFNVLFVALCIALLLFNFTWKAVLDSSWYHVLEGVVTLSFVLEIALRLALMRDGFWASITNFADASMCIFCVCVFLLISFSRKPTREEHTLLLILRYVSQLTRLCGFCRAFKGTGLSDEEALVIGSSIVVGKSASPSTRSVRHIL